MDCSQDLWIVFLSNVRRPASCCHYDDVTDARLYSYDGVTWRYDFNQNELRSWLIKTYITDGTYTYNLYRDGNAVANNLTGNTYTDTNLPDGIYGYHVTTNYYGGESDPSNTVNVQIGVPTTQTINLTSGWNWFSTNLVITLDDLKAALMDVLGNTPVTIKSLNSNTTYIGGMWRGQLTSLDVTQMYMIRTGTDCQITLTGFPINITGSPVTIHNGNNWIGFPLREVMSLGNAFAGFAVEGDAVKSQNGNSTYNGTTWRGSLNTLMPGKGYIYKSNVQGNRTFTFPMVEQKNDR